MAEMTRHHTPRTTAADAEKQWCASLNGNGLQPDPRRTVGDQADSVNELQEARVTGAHLGSALETPECPISRQPVCQSVRAGECNQPVAGWPRAGSLRPSLLVNKVRTTVPCPVLTVRSKKHTKTTATKTWHVLKTRSSDFHSPPLLFPP